MGLIAERVKCPPGSHWQPYPKGTLAPGGMPYGYCATNRLFAEPPPYSAKAGPLARKYAGPPYTTGLLQKQDPLPPGRYWIDVFDYGPPAGNGVNGIAMLDAWLAANAMFVKVENSEHHDPDAFYPVSGNPAQNWVLFQVHDVPVPWGMQTKIGWPTIADANTKQKSDTVQRPPEQSASDFWFGSEGKFPWAPYAIFAGLLVGIVAVVRK